MASKQESVAEWQEQAKAYAKAERELKIERYFRVELRKYESQELLYSYDLPVEMFFRKHWVIEWRRARLVCQYPKEQVTQYLIPYDKTTGLDYGFNSALGTLTAFKAHITMLLREQEEYIAKQRGMLFFDESTDSHLIRIAEKLQTKRQQVAELEQRIKAMVESRNKLNKKQGSNGTKS